tara:strand:+ start:10810 stop:10947 length:138 start_codon:yes stop_codon:yes gene_type:complete
MVSENRNARDHKADAVDLSRGCGVSRLIAASKAFKLDRAARAAPL